MAKYDVASSGSSITILAIPTFPQGFEINSFPGDADPVDFENRQIAEVEAGANGDIITWSTPRPIMATVNVVPGSEADENLKILLDVNTVGKNKAAAKDNITMIVTKPDGQKTVFVNGTILSGSPSEGFTAASRFKTKQYQFAFEKKAN